MKPLLITLRTGRKLLVLPDTKVHLNGHVVITDTHSLFNDTGLAQPRVPQVKEKDMHREDNHDPHYLGYLRIESLTSFSPMSLPITSGWKPGKWRN